MAIFKSTNESTNKLQLKSARNTNTNTNTNTKTIVENVGNSDMNKTEADVPPSNLCIDEDAENTGMFFDKLLNCWGAEFSCDDYIHAELAPSQTRQVDDDQDQVELKKLEKEKKAVIARRKKRLAAMAEKKAAAERAKKKRDLIQGAADAKMKQQEDAKEAADDRHLQAEIKANEAKNISEIKMKKVVEARRQVKQAKAAMKMAKKEAKCAKKVAKKEMKQAKRAEKEAQVAAKKTYAARHKYAKAEAAAARKAAKEEAKKTAAARELVLQMEKEENQIRDEEDTIPIRDLRQKLKSVSPGESDYGNTVVSDGRQDSDDCDTVVTEADSVYGRSTYSRSSDDEMSNADFQRLAD